MSNAEAVAHWRRRLELANEERMRRIAESYRSYDPIPDGFYEALRDFLLLREKLLPDFPTDPALKLLAALANTPEGSAKATIKGITYGAGVPPTTALRYLIGLEAANIIERVPHPLDKRQVTLRLTPHGKRTLAALAVGWKLRLLWLVGFPLAVVTFGPPAWAAIFGG